MMEKHSRRGFLGVTAAAAAGAFGTSATASQSVLSRPSAGAKPKFSLGLASYTLRNFKLDDVLSMTRRVGLKHIAFKSMHLPLDASPEEIRAVAAKTRQTGLDLYGCGVVYMNKEGEVNQAFEYARLAGMKVIIGVPAPDLLGLVERKVKQYDILVAIHNHGPGDKVYPLPQSVYDKVKTLDVRIGLCMDIGHTQRMGLDPAEETRKYADRLHDVHIKDVSAATAAGSCVEMGRGVIDIPKFLATLIDVKYAGKVSFEYEKDANDPLAGLAESVGYARGVLDTLAPDRA